jgi:HD superfamily phosphohydrolase
MARKEQNLFEQDSQKNALLDKVTDLEQKLQKSEAELRLKRIELEEIKKENADYELLRADKTFGIAVCGDVLVNKLEVKIINTNEFQRLRKIKQLGSTFLVYPSAVHTRFEHSLGVLKSADVIIKSIRNNKHSNKEEKTVTPEEEQIIRLIALLHDIGHMPYGHTIEDEFGIFRSHDKHETRWDYLLGEDSTIGKIIIKERGLDFHKRFFQLIKCEKEFGGFENDAFVYDIVSNTVCADLLDYLNRDCFYTNLQLRYHPRFLNYFFIARQGKYRRIAIRVYKHGKKELRRDIISELIQLLRNRYYLGERVYYHHAKIKTGTVIAGAVLRAKAANCFQGIDIQDEKLVERIKSNIDSTEDKLLYDIHKMGDDELVSYLMNLSTKSKNEQQIKKIQGAINLAEVFDKRIKYEELLYKTKDDLGIEDEFDTDVIGSKEKKPKHDIADKLFNRFIKYGTSMDRLQVEDNICDYLEMNSGDLLIYCPNFNMAMKLAKVKVEDDKKDVQELREFNDKSIRTECKSILDKHQALWALRVFIHPKYVNESHENYKHEYEEYKDLILKYCDWTILAKDAQDEKSKADIFWSAYINYKLSIYEEAKSLPTLGVRDKTTKIKELIADFSDRTFGKREYKDILDKIEKKFQIQK